MLNYITIGQYYPVDSPVLRLDPRIKLILTIGFIVSVFLAQSFSGYVLLFAFIFFVTKFTILTESAAIQPCS